MKVGLSARRGFAPSLPPFPDKVEVSLLYRGEKEGMLLCARFDRSTDVRADLHSDSAALSSNQDATMFERTMFGYRGNGA